MNQSYINIYQNILSIFSMSIIPISVLLMGLLSISKSGIHETVTLSVVTAVSAVLATWFQNSHALPLKKITKSIILKIFFLGLLNFLLTMIFILSLNLNFQLSAIIAGLIYGTGCSAYNLYNRMAIKYLSAAQMTYITVTTTCTLLVILFFYSHTANFLI